MRTSRNFKVKEDVPLCFSNLYNFAKIFKINKCSLFDLI